jgi:hypothetical protein
MKSALGLIAVLLINQAIAWADEVDYRNISRINKEVAEYKKKKAIEDAMYEGRIVPGMDEYQVRRALGNPTRINVNGEQAQWVYDTARGGSTYVYFEHGLTR